MTPLHIARMRIPLFLMVVCMALGSLGCRSSTTESAPQAVTRTTGVPCPEIVRRLPNLSGLRNADGHLRQCWPGMAKCFCDRDNDCYAEPGYVACVPLTTSPVDAGTRRDSGSPRDVVLAPDSGPVRPPVIDVPPLTDVPPLPPPTPGLRAFPGAEGFGANATGGRGGRVIYVTNLNPSGPGSFQDAVAQAGPRYVLFKVSGVINGDVQIRNGNLTIAGQTSPAGIIVRGLHTTEEPYCDQQCGNHAQGVENFIIRHVRSRPAGSDFPDGLRLRYARNGIIDHCSMGNASDEAVEISYTRNITIQDSLLAETIGGHAQYGGMLMNYTNPAASYALDDISVIRTVWNRLQGRFPEMSRESAGVAAQHLVMHVELVNNLLWDRRWFIDVNPTDVSGGTSGTPLFYQVNWIGNFSQAPAGNHMGVIWMNPQGSNTTTAYFADNHEGLWPARSDWDLNYCCSDYNGQAGARPAWARSTRHPFPMATAMPSGNVRLYAAANAGAFPRDAMDTRLMGFVAANQIDPRPSNTNPANDALSLRSTLAAPLDTDGDGMPDEWETSHGLSPSVANPNGTGLSMRIAGASGWTDLEVFLNELAARRVSENR